MQQTICFSLTSDDRAKYQRKSTVAKPRASCWAKPSRSARSRATMKIADAITNLTKRDSIGRCAVYGVSHETDSAHPSLMVRFAEVERQIRLCSPAVSR